MTSVLVNTTIRLKCTFTVDDTDTDPTTITLIVRDPDGDEETYTYADSDLTRDDTGIYSMLLSLTKSGRYTAYWRGTGTCAATDEIDIVCTRSDVVNA